MKTTAIAAAALLVATAAHAQQGQGADPALVEKAIASSWTTVAPELRARIEQDQTQKDCSEHRNSPPPAVADAIVAREKATIRYPADGKFLGDWKKGAASAQSGYGGRMGDDPKRVSGGNCYACHQLDPKEIAYGTLGPSLAGYGKIRNYGPEEAKAAYEKIYNAQALLACSNMPRFGYHGFLTPEQIKDLVAYLMAPDSPVNK